MFGGSAEIAGDVNVFLLYKIKDPNVLHCEVDNGDYFEVYPNIEGRYNNSHGKIDNDNKIWVNSEKKTVYEQITYPVGKFSNCLYFNGWNHYITNPMTTTYNLGASTAYTIDMWISCLNTQDNYIFCSKRSLTANSTAGDCELFFDRNALCFKVCTSSGSWASMEWRNLSICSDDIPNTHLAIVKTASERPKLYLNGKLQEPWNESAGTVADYSLQGSVTRAMMCIGAHYYYSSAQPNYDSLFKGYIEEFRIVNTAVWTADFTPPTSAYSTTTAATTKVLLHFNSNLTEEVSGVQWVPPVQQIQGHGAYNGKYSVQIAHRYNQGFIFCGPLYQQEKHYGFTIEVIAEYSNSTDNNANEYLFYIGEYASTTTNGNIYIKKRSDTSLSGVTCGGVTFCCGSKTVNTSGINCTSRHVYRICYEASRKYLYCYVDNTYIGGGACTYNYANDSHTAHTFIGFNPTVTNSGFGGWISEFKIITMAKYTTGANLAGTSYAYETWLLRYMDKSKHERAVELHPAYDIALARKMRVRNYLNVRLTATNGNQYNYWLPLNSTQYAGTGSYHIYGIDVHIEHPNGERCLLGPCVHQLTFPKFSLDNGSSLASALQQWYVTRYDGINTKGIYDDKHPECFVTTPRKLGSYSFYDTTEVICDHTSNFNFAGNWTVDFFVYFKNSRSMWDDYILQMFGMLGICGSCLYNINDGQYIVELESYFQISKWYYIGVRHPANTDTLYWYVDGKVVGPSSGTCYPDGEDQWNLSTVSHGSSLNIWDDSVNSMTKAGVITLSWSLFDWKNNDKLILGAESRNYYLSSFRIRTSSTACTTVPTAVITSSSNTYALFNFDDLAGF